jgi:hypothetical protein
LLGHRGGAHLLDRPAADLGAAGEHALHAVALDPAAALLRCRQFHAWRKHRYDDVDAIVDKFRIAPEMLKGSRRRNDVVVGLATRLTMFPHDHLLQGPVFSSYTPAFTRSQSPL